MDDGSGGDETGATNLQRSTLEIKGAMHLINIPGDSGRVCEGLNRSEKIFRASKLVFGWEEIRFGCGT